MHADTKRILVIVTLALLVATGLITTMSACLISKSLWPLLPLVIGGMACLLLFGSTMAENIIGNESSGMPSYLRDGEDDSADTDLEAAWFLLGHLCLEFLLLLLYWHNQESC